MRRPTPLPLRFLAVAMAVVLLLALVLLVLRRNAEQAPGPQESPAAAPSASSAPRAADEQAHDGGTSATDVVVALERLSDVDLATGAGAEALMDAAAVVAQGPWAELDAELEQSAAAVRSRPVYVAHAIVDEDRRAVTASVAIAVPADDDAGDVLALRFLAGADAVVAAGSLPEVAVEVDGVPAPAEIDTGGARLLITDERFSDVDGPPLLVRIDLSYEVPDRRDIVDDGGPAGFGLLAWNPDVTVLGHFLPLVTFEPGPMLPYGDVGSFPPAVWSMMLTHAGTAVTGGDESLPCPAAASAEAVCTWARGVALRDMTVAVFDDAPTIADGDGVRVAGASRRLGEAAARQLLAEAVASRDLFLELFGPLAWPDLEVVVAPLTSGAAGMEFPGLVIVRDDTVGSLRGGFGTYVTAHEVAHQWFHALLGSGSLGAPVVDESLAQYASVLFYADEYGESGAAALVDRYYRGRYERWRNGGGTEVAPGATLQAFGGSAVYGPMVYARGALAWLAAEEAVGREAVVTFVADLVEAARLEEVTVAEVVAAADADLAAVLQRWWLDPAPIPAGDVP